MSAAFLSAEHLAAAADLLNGDEAFREEAAGVSIAINYVITDGPEGDFSYFIAVIDGEARLARGEVDDPDATLRSSYKTAAKISRGEVTSQVAVMTRKIKVRGSVAAIVKHMTVMARFETAINSISTEY